MTAHVRLSTVSGVPAAPVRIGDGHHEAAGGGGWVPRRIVTVKVVVNVVHQTSQQNVSDSQIKARSPS